MRRAPRPRLRRWSAAEWPALLHEFSGVAIHRSPAQLVGHRGSAVILEVIVIPRIRRHRLLALITVLAGVTAVGCDAIGAQAPVTLPDPETDEPVAMSKGQPTAVFAGGCFWGIEAIFEHVKGVKNATSGYAGGDARTANYDAVSSGRTGHAESVKLTYDRSQVTYGQLLKVFFSVGLDPTELNRQGHDEGPQYRSVLFVTNAEQKRIAEAYIAQLEQAKVFKRHIVTEVAMLADFFDAEDYHQNFVARNPANPY